MKQINRKKANVFKNHPVDEANLDLHFIEAFVDLLDEITKNVGTLEMKKSTIAAMCYETHNKIDALKQFINAVPMDMKDVKAA
jgi:hypothetical protein